MARRMRIPEAEPFGIKNPRIRKLIQQRFERGERFHYPMSRLACIREVDKLRRKLMPRLGQITCPTLIVHADEDDITSPRSAHHLQKHLGGPVDFMPLSDSYHMILVDNERMAVLARSVDFFQSARHRKDTSRTASQWPAAPSPPESASASRRAATPSRRPLLFRAAKFQRFIIRNKVRRFVTHRHQAGTARAHRQDASRTVLHAGSGTLCCMQTALPQTPPSLRQVSCFVSVRVWQQACTPLSFV
jgi:carboxylesterase